MLISTKDDFLSSVDVRFWHKEDSIAGQIKASKQRKTNKKVATFIHMQNPEMDNAISKGSVEDERFLRPL